MLPRSCPDSQSLLSNGQPACAFQLCLTLQWAWCGRSGAPDAAEVGFLQLLPCATHSMLIKGEPIRALEALLNGATGGGPKPMLCDQEIPGDRKTYTTMFKLALHAENTIRGAGGAAERATNGKPKPTLMMICLEQKASEILHICCL